MIQMQSSWQRRSLAAAVLVLVGLAPTVADAQDPMPTISISASPGTGGRNDDCRFERFVVAPATDDQWTHPGTFTVERTGDTTAPLTVDVAYQGEALLVDQLPTEAVIPAGETSVTVPVAGPDHYRDNTVVVTVSAGSGYEPGDPATATVTFANTGNYDLGCMFRADAVVNETILVGQQPSADLANAVVDLQYDDMTGTFETDDPLPAGLSVDNAGVWSGAATTVGTTAFTGYLCDDHDYCFRRIEVSVEVTTDATTTSTGTTTTTTRPTTTATAPAATPVRSTATYTG